MDGARVGLRGAVKADGLAARSETVGLVEQRKSRTISRMDGFDVSLFQRW